MTSSTEQVYVATLPLPVGPVDDVQGTAAPSGAVSPQTISPVGVTPPLPVTFAVKVTVSPGDLPCASSVTETVEEIWISLTVPSTSLVTHTWLPSDETPKGSFPTGIAWTPAPGDASSSRTVPSVLPDTTHTWVPSDDTANEAPAPPT